MSGSNIPSIEDKAGVPHEVPRAVEEVEVGEATLNTSVKPSEGSNVVVNATPDVSENSPGLRDAVSSDISSGGLRSMLIIFLLATTDLQERGEGSYFVSGDERKYMGPSCR